MSLERLAARGAVLGQTAVATAIDRLVQTPVLPGVHVEAGTEGIILSGKRLRRRMIDEPQLRNFGQ